MAFELCKDCGRMHWATDECPAKKSTAARKDVPGEAAMRAGSVQRIVTPQETSPTAPAGTQALPVDTTSRASEPPKAVPKDRHPPGYMASFMRQWRAKRKATEK